MMCVLAKNILFESGIDFESVQSQLMCRHEIKTYHPLFYWQISQQKCSYRLQFTLKKDDSFQEHFSDYLLQLLVIPQV